MLLIISILAIIFAFIAGICVFIFTNAAKIAAIKPNKLMTIIAGSNAANERATAGCTP